MRWRTLGPMHLLIGGVNGGRCRAVREIRRGLLLLRLLLLRWTRSWGR